MSAGVINANAPHQCRVCVPSKRKKKNIYCAREAHREAKPTSPNTKSDYHCNLYYRELYALWRLTTT
eukprot:scaffold48601_cov309-Isochrysis_galbana.AAC.2